MAGIWTGCEESTHTLTGKQAGKYTVHCTVVRQEVYHSVPGSRDFWQELSDASLSGPPPVPEGRTGWLPTIIH